MKFTGICTQQNQFTGATTQKDFSINNCHILQFYKNEKFIAVDVAGFSASHIFNFNPEGKEVKLNLTDEQKGEILGSEGKNFIQPRISSIYMLFFTSFISIYYLPKLSEILNTTDNIEKKVIE